MGAVLVTGGAGYIGSHVTKALRIAGRDVVVLDSLAVGHREAVCGAPLVEADIADTETVRQTIRKFGVTSVMHLAAFLSVGESVLYPDQYYVNNVSKTIALIKALVSESVECLIFSSTAAVYGESEEIPITEDHLTRPSNAYGETKLAVERALPHYERAYGLRSMCLRYFNAAGADEDGEIGEDHDPEEHLIPRALAAASGGVPLIVFGKDYKTEDGTCRRDYVHVSDLAAAHILALAALEEGKLSTLYNLGNDRSFSVREVIAAVERVTGTRVPHEYGRRRAGDPAILLASSKRARLELGWDPVYRELDEIVKSAWQWHRSHPKGYGE
jgi:UDP-glucose-4-epimerase GalE